MLASASESLLTLAVGWPANVCSRDHDGSDAQAVLGVNIVQSPVLSSLYGFTPSQVGNSNLALLVGAVTGLLTAGPFSDWLSIRLTKRNNDVREACVAMSTPL